MWLLAGFLSNLLNLEIMTLQECQEKKKRSLIVICTLGLAAIPFALNWESNIFKGTSADKKSELSFIFKVISFVLLAIPCIVFGFIYHFFRYFNMRSLEKKLLNNY